MSEAINVPAVMVDATAVARIKSEIDISDRSRIVTFGDRAQRSVVEFADRILAQTQNRELGTTGKLLSDILGKARGLDPATLKDSGFFTRLFSSMESRLRRFSEQFGDVASQIDRVCVELDRNKETLRRDIAVLDELHEQTKASLGDLDSHIAAGKTFAEDFRRGRLIELEQAVKAAGEGSDALLAAQTYQDAAQALDRLEKRVFYLQQARQIGIQQLPQIRIVQSGDETLIENLQATTELTIPVWKQKMILLLGLTRQKSALDLQKTVTDATNEMMKQASEMMKTQAIEIEKQSQRGIIDIATLEKTNSDLVDTISGVLNVQAEGRKKRAEIEQRMAQLTDELKSAMSKSTT
ncbi:toxic anion resistance protein [Bradyrhizobium sp. AUGA SZCCT0240]|uniref:toxic anion resistance protein n=1 Tax=unclassified Bradyrhizobium TaxID=2631580 RepID=UPI001BACEF4A|nr:MULTISPECIES: toxic anion resistance protein [unclassified Bradyrhizobium]MBR1200718.1 toxic anion resistance protein [Bradyrhizobium sp. AUGA SZCCT0158]MBR1242251.1 toxic anion resistance protein [Bradyrhizobium sp. AUGA SZCCT0274]MBR1256891.1 toxic anion resistance protein [Bradyrhizobium sp. AUGA SZCCT0240]